MTQKPTFEPFEVTTDDTDTVKITTWRHPNGELEQWHDDKFYHGPKDRWPEGYTPPAPSDPEVVKALESVSKAEVKRLGRKK